MANIFTGQHFGGQGNRQQLINAMNSGLIDERQYKLMSGYDARKEMGMTPVQTLGSSAIYNTAKGVRSPQDFEGKIGPIKSTLLNTIGSTGYGFDQDKYQGILDLNPEAFNKSPTGPYGSNYNAQLAQRSGLAPAYDFDFPSGITRTNAAQTMNTGNKYANLADDAWANKQTILTPGGEIVVDTESGQVAPDIASFPGDEIQETETEQFPLDTNWQEILNRNNEEEQYGILAPNRWQQFLSKVTHQPYRGAQRHTRDFTPAQLNRMNALGGQYSEPARQQRRERSRVANMLARQAAGKSYSQQNLNQLTMGSRPGHYDRPGGDPTPRGTDTPSGHAGGWGPGARAKGGIIGAF